MSGSINASLLIDAFPVVQKLTNFDYFSSLSSCDLVTSDLGSYFGRDKIGGLRSKEQR